MRFIGKRLGLILWAFVVILVLSVPLLRLRASWQWQNPLLFGKATWFDARGAGLTGRWEEEAIRRFPNDPIAVMAPIGSPSRYYPAVYGKGPGSEDKSRDGLSVYFARYDALEKRFPASNAVRAQHLRGVTTGGFAIDTGPQPDETVQMRADFKDFKPWLHPRELEIALATAREGARREPDNAFFPWMQAIFNFSLKRDDAAISALKRAGDCTRFDDYVMTNVRERLVLLRQLRVTGWEDDSYEYGGALLPHYAPMLVVTRAVMGRARLARTRGDQARALELAGIVQRAGAVVERTDGSLIQKNVGRALCLEAWNAIIENEPNVPKRGEGAEWDTEDYGRQIAALFAGYAREHERPDIAAQATTIAAKFDTGALVAVYRETSVADFVASSGTLTRASWLSGNALFFGFWASLFWALWWPFSRRTQDAVARRQSLLWSVFMAGMTLALWFFKLRWDVQSNTGLWSEPSEADKSALALSLHSRNEWLIVSLWLTPILVALLWRLLRWVKESAMWRIQSRGKANWLALTRTLLLIGFSVGWAGVALGVGQPDYSIWGQLFLVFMAFWLGCAFTGSVLMLVFLRARARVLAFCGVVAFWFSLAPSLLFSSFGDGPFYSSIASAVAIIAGATGLFIVLQTREIVFPRQQIANYAFQFAARTRIAAGVLALLCALAYFGITLWTIPIEAKTRAMMARQMQIGEVAWLREQMKGARNS